MRWNWIPPTDSCASKNEKNEKPKQGRKKEPNVNNHVVSGAPQLHSQNVYTVKSNRMCFIDLSGDQ